MIASRSHGAKARTGTCSPEIHIEDQATNHAIPHEDAGRTVDLAQQQADKEQMCHRANTVHKGRCLDPQKLWVLDTEMEAAKRSADSGRNNVALCYNAAVASDSEPSP